ncbi:hypothetical protein SELMODRAFT_429822 [Selaginella moellendorffii]|uniref:Phospholipid/glycerol acyltransferase domain-containing protein n=1 Tax=Selaginella moellendorffii TaxID=88036 RepID=D8T7F0_SELML|nr:hypothetical protein SELMODRAFT_429822 [Selaginella moellendorffii]
MIKVFRILFTDDSFAMIMQKYINSGIAVRSNGVVTKSTLESKPSFGRDTSYPESTILLIFPEGTCKNKEDIVMFKQIVFELDFTVCPVAIKLKLMSSWVVVCDVWYVEPQINDAPIGFSEKYRNELKLRKSLEILRPSSKLTEEEEQLIVVPLENPVAYAFFLHGPETPLDNAKKIKNKDKFME